MADPELDEITLRAAVRRDPAACRRLVARYQSLVFATAARVLGPRSHDVPDVAQESFLRAFEALDGFDPRGPARLSTWLATVTARVAIDHARRRRTVVPLDDVREVVRDPGLDPHEALDAAQRRARLTAAMAALGPEQRAVMLLRTEHDMHYDAIARSLGVEVGTVRSRLSRAKQALCDALGIRHEEARHG